MSTTPSRPNFVPFLLGILGGICVAYLLFTRNPIVSSVTGTLAPKSVLSLSDNRFVATDGMHVTLWRVTSDNKLERLDSQLLVDSAHRMEGYKSLAPTPGAMTGSPPSPVTTPMPDGNEFSKQTENTPEPAEKGTEPPQSADVQAPVR